MKILYFDAIYHKGHKFYDSCIIDNLASFSELTVICPKNWYNHTSSNVSYVYNAIETNLISHKRLRIFFDSISNYKKVLSIIKKEKFDYIVAGEYEILSFKYFLKHVNCKVMIIHHYNLDQISRRKTIKRLFDGFKDKVNHIVIEKYLVEILVNIFGVSKEKVFLWPNPINTVISEYTTNDKLYDCVGISNSNDQFFVDDVICKEKETGFLKKNKIKLVLKSSNQSFDDGFLIVVCGYLEEEMFKHYMDNAKSILICYSNSYLYRGSGIINDAIARRVPVVGRNNLLLKSLKADYPSIIELFETKDQLVESIKNAINSKEQFLKRDFLRFIEERSEKNIQKLMKDSLVI